MHIISLEAAIADFLALGRRLQQMELLTGEHVLDEVTVWYHDSRIAGAALDEDGDMLLLQWGATRPLDFVEPTDLRIVSNDQIHFFDAPVRYLDFTRQVFVTDGDDTLEFDDSAVQMSITLCYALATGNEVGSNLWISTPDQIDHGKSEFYKTPFVHQLRTIPAERAVVTVGLCG